MPDRDRLEWIFETDADALAARYDQWAATYDDDNDDWGWIGPDLVANTVLRLGENDPAVAIHDAGCGTGKVGIALRRAGWTGPMIGLDFSQGMLDVAARSGAYDELIRCSLYDLPFPTGVAGAVVSCGVFTHGHVGGEALAELARITAPGGVVSLTQRLDVENEIRPHAEALVDGGTWQLQERSEPRSFYPERGDGEQTVTSWQVMS